MAYYSLTLGTPFGAAFYGGAGTSSLTPGLFPIALNGSPYMVDMLNPQFPFRRDSLPLLRAQADSSSVPGESTLSPESSWRRASESWHRGAGQSYFDRPDSDSYRFDTSKGVDPWTKYQLTLLNGTTLAVAATGSNLYIAVAGSYLYFSDGTGVKYTTDGSTFTTVTAFGTGNVVGLASDGKFVWAAKQAGVFQIDTSSTPGTAARIAQPVSGQTLNGVWWNKNRLFASQSNGAIYNVNDTTDKVMAHSASVNPVVVSLTARGFTWTSATGGNAYHYLGGFQGDKSLIYKTQLAEDASALTVGVVAGALPDGERLQVMVEYLGIMVLGSDLGVRLASIDSEGNLIIGGLVEIPNPVYSLEPQNRFVWYGWTNYDSTSTGLGRLDLSEFTATLTPAYASDLMATTQGTVQAVATWSDKRVFTVNGVGLYVEDTATPVSEGTLTSGAAGFGIVDPKVAVFLDVLHSAEPGTIRLAIKYDNDDFLEVSTHDTSGDVTDPPTFLNGIKAIEFQVRTTLVPSGSSSPELKRWVLRAYPAPVRLSRWQVPVMLYDQLLLGSTDYGFDVAEEYRRLVDLHSEQIVFQYQEGLNTFTVVMDDFTWMPEKASGVTLGSHQGILVAQLRQLSG